MQAEVDGLRGEQGVHCSTQAELSALRVLHASHSEDSERKLRAALTAKDAENARDLQQVLQAKDAQLDQALQAKEAEYQRSLTEAKLRDVSFRVATPEGAAFLSLGEVPSAGIGVGHKLTGGHS